VKFDAKALSAAGLRGLAAEFKQTRFGLHSPLLKALLDRLRLIHPGGGKLVLICTRPCAEWALGRISSDPPQISIVSDVRFTSLEDAEWHVFQMRWRDFFGRDLDLG